MYNSSSSSSSSSPSSPSSFSPRKPPSEKETPNNFPQFSEENEIVQGHRARRKFLQKISFLMTVHITSVFPVFLAVPLLLIDFFGDSPSKAAVINSYLSSACSIITFFAVPLLGKLSDKKFGRKKIVLCVLLLALSSLILEFLAVLLGLETLMIIGRITSALDLSLIALSNTMIADASSANARTRNMSVVFMSTGMAYIFGAGLSAVFSTIHGLAAPLLFGIILCTINIIFLITKFPETLGMKHLMDPFPKSRQSVPTSDILEDNTDAPSAPIPIHSRNASKYDFTLEKQQLKREQEAAAAAEALNSSGIKRTPSSVFEDLLSGEKFSLHESTNDRFASSGQDSDLLYSSSSRFLSSSPNDSSSALKSGLFSVSSTFFLVHTNNSDPTPSPSLPPLLPPTSSVEPEQLLPQPRDKSGKSVTIVEDHFIQQKQQYQQQQHQQQQSQVSESTSLTPPLIQRQPRVTWYNVTFFSLKYLYKHRSAEYRLAVLLWFIVLFCLQAFISTALFFVKDRYNWGVWESSLALGWTGCCFIVQQFCFMSLMRRYALREKLAIKLTLLLSLCGHVLTGLALYEFLFFMAIFLTGAMITTTTCLSGLVSKMSSASEQATVLTSLHSVNMLATLLGGLLFPALMLMFEHLHRGKQLASGFHFFVSGGLLLVAFVLSFYLPSNTTGGNAASSADANKNAQQQQQQQQQQKQQKEGTKSSSYGSMDSGSSSSSINPNAEQQSVPSTSKPDLLQKVQVQTRRASFALPASWGKRSDDGI